MSTPHDATGLEGDPRWTALDVCLAAAPFALGVYLGRVLAIAIAVVDHTSYGAAVRAEYGSTVKIFYVLVPLAGVFLGMTSETRWLKPRRMFIGLVAGFFAGAAFWFVRWFYFLAAFSFFISLGLELLVGFVFGLVVRFAAGAVMRRFQAPEPVPEKFARRR